MPSSDSILTGLAATASDWHWLAVVWHVVLATLTLALLGGWRPAIRSFGRVVAMPIASVSVVSWISGNPFNGALFAALAAALYAASYGMRKADVDLASGWVVPGGLLVAFGWGYPHFAHTQSWVAYTYASPFGLLPCPTLSVVIGLTLIGGDLRSTAWNIPLIVAGLLYGSIGVFRLGVVLDVTLLAGAIAHAAAFANARAVWRSVRADRLEQTRPLPGDEFISAPLATLTHAVSIGCPATGVWPWLAQMGAGTRGGWYSYDFLDNGRSASATRVIPELQNIAVGTLFPALPGVNDGFHVLAFEPYRWLVLSWLGPNGRPLVTWAFVLERGSPDSTRLLVRVRAAEGYRFHRLPTPLSQALIRLVHFVMERKQLLGIARRAESLCAATLDSPSFAERQTV
jgi:hypothetical protein